MWPSALVCIWGHSQALSERDSFKTENRLKMGGESGPRSVNQEQHTQPSQELCGGLCGATEWGPGLRGWGMSGQDPEGYVQCCQMSMPGRGPRVLKSLTQRQTLRQLGTLQPGTHLIATASQAVEAQLTRESSFSKMFPSCVLTD